MFWGPGSTNKRKAHQIYETLCCGWNLCCTHESQKEADRRMKRELWNKIYGTTFSCQQAMNCTHYCHCVALSIPKHCDLLEAWFANSTTWTHFSQYHKSTDFISGTNALSSRNAYALCTSYETVKVFFFMTTTFLTCTMLQKQAMVDSIFDILLSRLLEKAFGRLIKGKG